MNADVLEKVNQLSPEKQQEVEDFINYLLTKYTIPTVNDEAAAEKRRKNLGWAKGKIWMADDFMDTPDDFKDYM